MKTIKRILFLVAVALGLASCGSNHVDVAEEFITNFNTGNYDKAKEYCTEGAKSIVDLAVSFKHKPVEDWKTEIVRDSVFSDDSAAVWYINAKGKEDKIDLKKVDGEWLVDVKK